MSQASTQTSTTPAASPLAPCVAVIGPANAGKTTLLHQLDEKLKPRLDSFLVLKGNPDGSGRYLYQAPELRNDPDFKSRVKGKWGAATVDHVCDCVANGRRNLSLALLDFGGRHDAETAEGNARMLHACSHYIVVSRDTDLAGASCWDGIGRDHGLERIGWMRSLASDDERPAVCPSAPGIEATFQWRVMPGDPVNDAALAPLVDRLVALAVPPDRSHYVNLHQTGRWTPDQIADVAGLASKIAELARRTGVVVLGGAAPVWAFLAGLRCALTARADARVFFYDPRQPERLVEIPAAPGTVPDAEGFPADALELSWQEDAGRSVLHFRIATVDKFLPPTAAQNLAGAPVPPAAPTPDVAISGAGPTWLFGVYARWLIAAGATGLSSWDAGTTSFIRIW